jgi:hypothetical protein
MRRAAYSIFFLIVPLSVMLASPKIATANPTQEEVFKSINQNVGSTVDPTKALPYIIATLAGVALLVWLTKRSQQQTTPRVLNNTAKLLREISKKVKLRSAETKMLKILAEEEELSSPLILLLCPSLLAKAGRKPNPRVDRHVLMDIVTRLRQSRTLTPPIEENDQV